MLKVEIFFLQLFLKEKENSCKLKKKKKKESYSQWMYDIDFCIFHHIFCF